MSNRRSFVRNLFSSTGATVVNIATMFFLSPFIVTTLGPDGYGIWTLISTAVGFAGLLDLGIRTGVAQYVTRYWAQGDMERVNRTFSTSILVLLSASAVVVAGTVVLALILPGWVEVSDRSVLDDGQWAFAIMGGVTAINFAPAVLELVCYARQRFDIESGIRIVARLVGAGLIVWALWSGHGILGLAVCTAFEQFVRVGLSIFAARRLMPGVCVSPSLFDRAHLRELYAFGLLSFAITGAWRVVLYTDSFVIGSVLTATAITYYAIGANLMPYFGMLLNTAMFVFRAHATGVDARGDRDELRRLLLVGTRGTTLVATILAMGMVLLGRDFIALWMGQEYVASGDLWSLLTGTLELSHEKASSALIMAVLALAHLVRNTQLFGVNLLLAMRELRFIATLAACEAVLNLGISLALVGSLGILGVAIGTLIPSLLLQCFAMGWNIRRKLEVSGSRYALEVLRGLVPASVAMVAAFVALDGLLPASGWGLFLLKAALVALPAVPAYLVFTAADERRALWSRMRRR